MDSVLHRTNVYPKNMLKIKYSTNQYPFLNPEKNDGNNLRELFINVESAWNGCLLPNSTSFTTTYLLNATIITKLKFHKLSLVQEIMCGVVFLSGGFLSESVEWEDESHSPAHTRCYVLPSFIFICHRLKRNGGRYSFHWRRQHTTPSINKHCELRASGPEDLFQSVPRNITQIYSSVCKPTNVK
jgi:hypothetical protein